jgi:signal transduction histidine kinase
MTAVLDRVDGRGGVGDGFGAETARLLPAVTPAEPVVNGDPSRLAPSPQPRTGWPYLGPMSALIPPPARRAVVHPGALGSVLQALATKCMELVAADLCQVYLAEEHMEEHMMVLRAEAPNEPATISGPGSLALGSGFAASIIGSSEPVRLEDVSQLEGPERIWLDRGMWSIAGVLLAAPGEIGSGILIAARSHARPFTDDEIATLRDLATEVGQALASADLVSRAEELAVLKERIKLAREIHDGLASDLSAVVALFKYHEHRRKVDPEDADKLLLQMRDLVENCLQNARDILATLRPRPSNIKRLGEVIRRHVEDFGRTYDLSTVVSFLGDDSDLVIEERDTIYQILREALTNVRRHAEATAIEVTLDLRQRPYVLVVEDDGVGIDLKALAEAPGSFGIMGMRERAQLVGGSIEVTRGDQGGTRLYFRGPEVPLGEG